VLIINADDWGLDEATTDAIAKCYRLGRVTATSAMVFMDDSIRAARIAREIEIDVGLHLNLTEPFTSETCSPRVREAQQAVSEFLRKSKLASLMINPRLHGAFKAAVSAQIEEFRRIYGSNPSHIDGHHHQHLGANVLFGGLLPADSIARRHFTFYAGEKSWLNRTYRAICDRILALRCTSLDAFFDLTQHMRTPKMQRLATIAGRARVELMVHPAQPAEFEYLTGEEFGNWLTGVKLGDFRTLNKPDMKP